MFSEFFKACSPAGRIAFLGVFAALSIVTNTFSIDIGASNKLAFTYLMCFMAAYTLGALPAFFVAFFGDTIGFLLNPQGGIFWLYGVTLGMYGVVFGLCFKLPFKGKKGDYIKAAIGMVAAYVLVTLILNTVVSYYYVKIFIWHGESKKTMLVYLAGRIGFQSLVFGVNAALCFASIPLMQGLLPHFKKKKRTVSP